MEIVLGTYEELILSYKLHDDDKSFVLEESFTDHSHTGNVKAVAISSKGILASGSSDETVRLFNIRTRKEVGRLMHHEGSITGLSFYGKKYFFSSSEDGTIGVWQVGRWECLRTLKGHKGCVNCVSIHPSGKLALSVGKDKTLRTWNLMTAKCAYVTNIKADADSVNWSPDGTVYLVSVNNKVDIYSVETSKIVTSITVPSRINVIKFIKDEVAVLTGEGGTVYIYNIKTGDQLYEFSTDTNRVKGLAVFPLEEDLFWLITGSSDGFVKVWKLNSSNWTVKLVVAKDTKFRITCLAAFFNESDHKEAAGDTAQKVVQEEVESDKEDEASDDDDDDDNDDDDDTQSAVKKVKGKSKRRANEASASQKKKCTFEKIKKKKKKQS